MGVTTIPAPAQQQTGNILQFLLDMSSLEERKEYRKTQDRYTDIAEASLGLKQKEFAAGKPARKEAALVSKGRRKTIKGLMLTEKQLAQARRTLSTSIAYGDKDSAAASRFFINKLNKVKSASPIALETILFADELYKDSRAQLALSQQQVASANQGMQTLEMMMKQQNLIGNARLKGIADMVKQTGGAGGKALVDNIDRIMDPSQNIADITADLMSQIGPAKDETRDTARQRQWIDPSNFTKKEREKFDPKSLAQYEDAFRNTGRGVETMTITRPKDQRRFWYKDSNELTLTRKRAIEIGVVDIWDATKSSEATKVQPKDKSTTPLTGVGMRPQQPLRKRKTIKELADERAKKAKKSTTKKSPYSQYPDAFLENGVWKVIKDGVKYRIED